MDTSELLTILEQLERDKGINKEILIQAVEAAVASAAQKFGRWKRKKRSGWS